MYVTDPLAELVGADLRVPVADGGESQDANLDVAATAPCLVAVKDAVDALLPWYSSVHRGAGAPAQVCTRAYEQARETVREFAAPGPGHTVVFTRNTTDAFNLLSRCLPGGTTVKRSSGTSYKDAHRPREKALLAKIQRAERRPAVIRRVRQRST